MTLIRERRGPYRILETLALAEGEFYEAGIVLADNSVFEMMWIGGHDGHSKLVGGGFQTTVGEPQFAGPVGAVMFDPTTCTLWVSTKYEQIGVGTGTGTGSGTGSGTWFGFEFARGKWCPISETGGGVHEIDTQSPITGGPILAGQTGTIGHATSGVSPGSYTSANITVDAYGHVTAASNGTAASGGGVVQVNNGDTISTTAKGKLVVAQNGGSVTMPLASSAGSQWYMDFLCVAGGTSNLTLQCQGSDTINGSSAPVIGKGYGGRIFCDGTTYWMWGGLI